ncbi:MAG: hypothetical protein H5T86_00520 [Armatimonadetes bacterium]|nr:hypothetical protein [Armatimonadota bacterium]
MKRLFGVTGALLVVVVLVSLPALAQQPGPGQGRGPGGRGMGAMMMLERSWMTVCFGIGASRDQIEKLWETYQNAWNARMEALNKLRAAQDRRAAFQEFAQTMQMIQADLENKLKEVLSQEQLQKYNELMQAGMGQRPGQGPPQGGGRGRGPGGPPGGQAQGGQ